jgi:putative membrane protein
VVLFHHGDRFFGGHGWWWGFFGGILPALLLIALIGIAVWAVLRLTGRGPGSAYGWAPAAPPVARPDGALEEVRLRYARGEISREEFLQRAQDLGATESGPGSPRPLAG